MREMLRNRGFTLIELMIVVVIIGILAAIAIPKFTLASWEAKEREADVLVKQVYTLQMTYFSSNGAYASTADQLATIGFSAPTHLEYYSVPAANAYSLPLCVTSLGAWRSRQIDLQGVISNC